MALADIVLNDGQAVPVAHTFAYVATVDGRTIRSDFAADAETPLTLTHSHRSAVKGAVTTKSHLLRFDISVLDADGVTVHKANIRIMADVPNPIASDALAADMAAYVRNWATENNVKAWVKGSVG